MARRKRLTHRLTESWLRAELVKLRSDSGMTVKQVADETGMHPRTIERIEVGPEPISADSLGKLLHLYTVGSKLRTRLRDMQQLANSSGWWDAWREDGLSPAYIEHCELEQVADKVDLCVTSMFHGLVHCEEYARWAQSLSPVQREGAAADRMIALRMERQRQFRQRNCPLRLLVDEAVLLAKRGPLPQQLAHLRDLESQLMLQTRVLPADGALAVPDTFGTFTAGARRVLCLGLFLEHHTQDNELAQRVQGMFDSGWHKSKSLFF